MRIKAIQGQIAKSIRQNRKCWVLLCLVAVHHQPDLRSDLTRTESKDTFRFLGIHLFSDYFMAIQLYRLLGQSAVATDGFAHSSDLVAALKKGGASEHLATQTSELLHEGEALIAQKIEKCGEDRIREHGLHFACSEAEMWLETIAATLRPVLDESTFSMVLAKALHAHGHALTVSAKMMRTLSAIASSPDIAIHFGDERAVKDVLGRGNAALARLIKTGEIQLRPKEEQEGFKIFNELNAFRKKGQDWFDGLENAATSLSPELCGWLGIVPKGKGIAVGGASRAVELHGRGQTTPPKANVYPCTGWSIGRQGNSENIGPGFIK